MPRKTILLACLYFFFFSLNIGFAQEPRLVIPVGHSQIVRSADFSPDGKRLLTGSYDSTVRLWDASTGSELLELGNSGAGLYSPQFSRDGKKILTARGDRTAVLWDVLSGKMLVTFKGHQDVITSVFFSSDEKKIITSSEDGEVRIWNALTGNLLLNLQAHTAIVNEARFSPDDKCIVSVSSDATTKIWDAHSGKLLHSLSGHTDRVIFARFSHDGKKLLTSSWDYSVKVWDLTTGTLLTNLDRFKSEIRTAEFSPDDKIIATGCYDKSVNTWSAITGEPLKNFSGHTGPVWELNFSRDGTLLLTAGDGNNARLWDVSTGQLMQHYNAASVNVNSAVFSPDGSKVALALYENKAMIWNRFTGKPLLELKGHSSKVLFSTVSPDQEKIITGIEDNTAKVWNIKTGKLLYTVSGHNGSLNTAAFSPDSKQLVTGSSDNTAKIINVATGKLVAELKGHTSGINLVSFSPDGKQIATASYDLTIKVWNAATGDSMGTYIHRDYINSIAFSPTGNYLLASSGDPSLQHAQVHYAVLWDIVNRKFIRIFDKDQGAVIAADFSPDGTHVLTVSKDGGSTVWETETGKDLFYLPVKSSERFSAGFSPDGKKVVCGFNARSAIVLDMTQGKMRREIKGYNQQLFPARYAPDGKSIAVAGYLGNVSLFDASNGQLIAETKTQLNNAELDAGNSAIVWEPRTGKKHIVSLPPGSHYWFTSWEDKRMAISDESKLSLFNIETGRKNSDLIAIDSNDYMVHLPSRQYLATQGATRLLSYVTPALKVISFEQLDVKFHRPDKVLSALGNFDSALIQSYHKAYLKRIKKLGIDTTAFRSGYSVPDADFANRDKIDFEQKDGRLKLNIKSADNTYKLDRFNIWVNEAPIFGQRGISLRRKHSNNFDSSITIHLSQGENRIETSVSNVNGTESYRIPLVVNYNPVIKQKEKTHFVGIGIDRFADNKYNLQYSAKDIRDLSKKLKEKYKDDITIDTLFNESVTLSNVKALKQKLLQSAVNDKVIIAYSGHGMLSKDYDYYLSTYAVHFENPVHDGLPYDELENLLDSIPARKKLLLIDACHSGEVDKEEMEKLQAMSESDTSRTQGAKGNKPLLRPGAKKLGMKNSFELMQQLFVNVGRSTGAVVISAAAGTQFALERGDLKNGVFTYAILEAMKTHPSMKISELKKIVGLRVEELTKGLQKPTSRNETIAVDWEVW